MKDRRFHSSDFIGSAGPGMAKLRAARVNSDEFDHVERGAGVKPTGLETVQAHMAAGEWQTAILTAAKFQDLGEQRDAILKGREAIMRPDFQRQLKRDPAVLIEAAKAALKERFG